jgi:hypothetical protein
MISGSNGERMWTSPGDGASVSSSSGGTQCWLLPAPSRSTGTSSFFRTRDSISAFTCGRTLVRIWTTESMLMTPCARIAVSSR